MSLTTENKESVLPECKYFRAAFKGSQKENAGGMLCVENIQLFERIAASDCRIPILNHPKQTGIQIGGLPLKTACFQY